MGYNIHAASPRQIPIMKKILAAITLVVCPAIVSAQTINSIGLPAVTAGNDFATKAFQDPWDMNERTDLGWLVGAQADVISPGTKEDTRVRTGVEYSLRNTTKLPERYIFDVYHRESVDRGRRDFTIQARGAVLVDNIEFRGVGGELRASFLVGSNVPKYSSSYSRADWDRFSRIYVLVGADSAERRKRNYGARVVYAAPFEADRAVESFIEWLRDPGTLDTSL